MPDRREFLAAVGGLLTADPPPGGLGVAIHSYPIRSRSEREKGFADPLRFLAFCRERGAAGVQLPLGTRDAKYTGALRAEAETHGLYVEGSVQPPKDRADLDRFEAEVKTATAAGAAVVRTVMLGGRRYEVFRTADQYREFKERAVRSLELAEPVMTRHRVRLAVENHKDYRAGELADLMKHLSTQFVGVCVDTGNNIALLEDPLETATVLAPWVAACHLKDMGAEETSDGFLLSEVPLGDGYLDLKAVVGVLRKANPAVRFSLEMITRDPLRIPCLTDGYWATFADVPGRDLARTLRTVRTRAGKGRLPRVGELTPAEQLALEDRNVERSLAYAKARLGSDADGPAKSVRVLIKTEKGDIEVELDAAKAPATVANFLRYADGRFYDGGRFHRSVTPDNQPDKKVKIEVVQAGINPEKAKDEFPAIKLERTRDTGLSHTDGTISMARDGPDTATSDFFICVGDQLELDFGGKRNPDGQGFAAFGKVVKGMDVVKKIQQAPAVGQTLKPPVKIISVTRR